MSNRFSKLFQEALPGNLSQSAIDANNHLAIESRQGESIFFSIYDLATGKQLINCQADELNPWYSLVAFKGNKLVVQYFENKKNPDLVRFFTYDPYKSKLGKEVGEEDFEIATVSPPILLHPEMKGFDTVKQFIGKNVVLGCEYEETEDAIVISYYLKEKTSFDRYLMVVKDAEVVYHEVQDTGLKGFAPGSFFTYQNRLIFVREKSELNIYEI